MNFLIEIRHGETGLATTFPDAAALGAFLAHRECQDWEGWENLQELPEFKDAFAKAAADPVGQRHLIDDQIASALGQKKEEPEQPPAGAPEGSQEPQP